MNGLDISAHDHHEFENFKLKEFNEYSSQIHSCDQHTFGEDTIGEWFYVDEGPVVSSKGSYKVIYHGTWGPDHSPGADCFTTASLYYTDDENDMAQFVIDLKQWQDLPEWREEEESL